MEQAGWERNWSAWITYHKLVRFVFYHSKAVQASRTSTDAAIYFAQTQKQIPSVIACDTFKKVFKTMQQQISNESIPDALDTYNL